MRQKKNLDKLDIDYEVIFVNDGSCDNSLEILKDIAMRDENVKIISLSKNYGHEAAMLAGIDHSSGDAVICMDADLQHPPSKIKEMLKKFQEGYEIINMVRVENKDAKLLKKITSKLFYRFLNKISPAKFEPNASDFFLISKRISDILKTEFRERIRFLRGIIQIIGFKRTTIEFVAPKRAGGKSKYSIIKLFKFSLTAISSFSNIPLHLGIIASVIVGGFSVIVGIYSIIMKMLGYVPPGYTTIVVLISFLFAIQFFLIGVIGQYLGYIYDENKRRPIYLIDKIIQKDKRALKEVATTDEN